MIILPLQACHRYEDEYNKHMSIDTLGKLFGSTARVKILKLFLFNTEKVFNKQNVTRRCKVAASNVSSEITKLQNIGLLSKATQTVLKIDKKTGKEAKKKKTGYQLNPSFKYNKQLQYLLVNTTEDQDHSLKDRMKSVGSIKLIVTSGVFMQLDDARVDLLVVGDRINNSRLNTLIGTLESELGTQIKYSVFETGDFKYRVAMYDRLVRDILDEPHHCILDKVGLDNIKQEL